MQCQKPSLKWSLYHDFVAHIRPDATSPIPPGETYHGSTVGSGSFWAISHQSKSDQLQLQSQRTPSYSPWNCLSLYAKYYSYEFNPLNVKICQVNPQNPWFRIGCISVGVGLQVGYLPVGLIVDTVYSNYSWWIRKELRTGGKTLQCWSTFMFPIIILIELSIWYLHEYILIQMYPMYPNNI